MSVETRETITAEWIRRGLTVEQVAAKWAARDRYAAKWVRQKELQAERIKILAEFGIKADAGDGIAGSIRLFATQADKLIRLLKRARRAEGK